RTAYDQLRARSSAFYPVLSQELREQTGIDNGYRACGGLVLPSEGEDNPTTEWDTEGVVYQRLDGAGFREFQARLGPMGQEGYYLPDLAQVRNPRDLRALLDACARLNVALVPHCAARALRVQGSRVEAVHTDGIALFADKFVVAAGAWSDELLRPLGWQPG